MKVWSLRASASDVLEALATWLQRTDDSEYRLSHHPDYHEGKWEVTISGLVGDQQREFVGRGDSPQQATIDAFLLADVPRP